MSSVCIYVQFLYVSKEMHYIMTYLFKLFEVTSGTPQTLYELHMFLLKLFNLS